MHNSFSSNSNRFAFFVLCLFMLITACKKESIPALPTETPEQPTTQRLLVKHIFDYNSTLRYAFEYNNANELQRCSTYDAQGHPERLILFMYNNGRLNSYIESHLLYTNLVSNMSLVYDSIGRLSRFWHQLSFNMRNGLFEYGSTNQVQRMYKDTSILQAEFGYAGGANCVTYVSHQNGTTTSDNFEYDMAKRPDIGLSSIYVLRLLYHLSDMEELVQAVSKNNITKHVGTGTSWTYTYNADGYPLTIQTSRNGQVLPNNHQYRLTYQALN